ncbi:MAG: HEAT repeat domain-containing protein, partial [Thermodesulfobacteriota bacterium]
MGGVAMGRAILAILAFGATALVTPCPGWAGFFWPSLPYAGPFAGEVRDRETGQPIAGAQLLAHWSCADLPIPHAPGEFHVYAEAMTGEAGAFRIEQATHRGGLAGCSFALTCRARGYITVTLIGDPEERELPPSTQAWPFVETRVQGSIPGRLDLRMKPALPVLIPALASENDQYRQVAAEELGGIGQEALPAVPALAKAAADRQPEVRRAAVAALGQIAAADPTVIAVLKTALVDPDPATRECGLRALQAGGPAASPALPALVAAVHDEDPVVRRRVPAALAAVAPADRQTVTALVEALADTDSRTRREAGFALAHLGDASLPLLLEFLCHEDPEVRRTIGRIVSSRDQAGLREAVRTGEPAARLAAVRQLGCLAGERREALPALVDLLADEQAQIQEAAVVALVGL